VLMSALATVVAYPEELLSGNPANKNKKLSTGITITEQKDQNHAKKKCLVQLKRINHENQVTVPHYWRNVLEYHFEKKGRG
jgi:hypothetical protein